MIKAIELIVVFTLLIFAFFAGVKYSESVKSHASWLFEAKGEEVELPDLSNESGVELDAAVNENGEVLNNGAAVAQDAIPADSINSPTQQANPSAATPAAVQ